MIDWHPIETVLLDLDGTLLDLHFDNYFWLTYLPKRYAEIHNIDLRSAEENLHKKINEYEGTLQWYCLEHWSDIVGLDIVELKREIRHKIQVRPHTKDFLTQLNNAKKQVVLVTNAHRGGLQIKLDRTDLRGHFDLIISSHDYQQPKEAPEFWQALSQQVQFDPERTIFLDDTPRILRSAQDFGIKHLVCMNQPDSKKAAKTSNEFLDIIHFSEIMPVPITPN